MFDEQPDGDIHGDIHGECANEIHRLTDLLDWCYSKLANRTFTYRPDALNLDEIKLLLEHGPFDDGHAREWVESEDSMRGVPLRAVLSRNDVTVIWHSTKSLSNNPVWEVIGQ